MKQQVRVKSMVGDALVSYECVELCAGTADWSVSYGLTAVNARSAAIAARVGLDFETQSSPATTIVVRSSGHVQRFRFNAASAVPIAR
jgi:hypothetical protein